MKLFDPIHPDSQANVNPYPDLIPVRQGKISGGFTLRNTDLPENGNMALHVCQNKEDVMKNRKKLEQTSLPLNQWVLPWQKHTDRIQCVFQVDRSKGAFSKSTSIMETDALYTTEPETLIGVFTADCLGILIADDSTPLVGVVHSGWKGTVQNILYKTLKELLEQDLIHPETVHLYFSPSILQNSFEIGEEVKEALMKAGKEIGLDYSPYFIKGKEGKWMADHQQMNLDVASSFGIPEENLHPTSLDTKTTDSCFSFRRDKDKTGEHLTFGYIRKD